MPDLRTGQPTPEDIEAWLHAMAEELWAIVAEESVLLQRKGQLAQAASQGAPLPRKVLNRKRRSGETLHRPAA